MDITTDQTLQGIGDIYQTTDKIILGLGDISGVGTNYVTITGESDIRAITSQTLNGEASIGINGQILYDRQTIYTPPRNGILGNSFTVNPYDPTYNIIGQNFNGSQFDTCDLTPVNPNNQTVMVVYRPSSLVTRGSIVGCIDNDKDSTTTGFSISVETNGQLTFRVQKNNISTVNNMTVKTPAGTVVAGQWQVATLRYTADTIMANINNSLFGYSNTFGINVDILPTNNNSFGWVLGNQGFVAPVQNQSLWGISIAGRTLARFNRITTIIEFINTTFWNDNEFDAASFGGDIIVSTSFLFPSPNGGDPYQGDIAYVLIWSRAITNQDILQTYFFLQNALAPRGIILP